MGPFGAPGPRPERRGSDEPPRVGGRRLRLHPRADPAVPRLRRRRLPDITRHSANSAAALRYPAARLDAARCGIALCGISPFGGDPAADDLRPALRWESEVAQVKRLLLGESTGYGRRYVADRPRWIGIVPVGYADGFRRDMTGTDVLIDGERCRVVGTVSMDAVAVELPGELAVGTPVTLLGDGILAEEHARIADTIAYEIVCGLNTRRRGRDETWSVSDTVGLRVPCRRSAPPISRAACSGCSLRSAARSALDVGCGTGALAYSVAPHIREVVGVDSSPELLAAARERAPANATFVEGDATALPSAGASSTSSAACACSITSVGRSSSLLSSRG